MLPSRLSHRAVAAAIVSIAFGSACSRSIAPFVANQRPTVELRSAPARSEGSQSVAYRIQWSGSDADGSVSHYEYAIDPPTAAQAAAGRETTWVRTDLREYSLEFGRSRDTGDKRALRERHTFVVRAIDMSADPATRASAPQAWVLDEVGVAPTVQITSPVPSALLSPTLPSPVDILWLGDDPDGQTTTRPVSYRTRLFGPADGQALQTWMAEPDSLRRFYEPLGYAGWDSLGADADRVALDSLQAGERYLFVVVAFDETGTPSANFSLTSNMLSFYAAPAGSTPPDLHVGWAVDGYETPPTSTNLPNGLRLSVPAGQMVDVRWFAIPPVGGKIKGYQWVLDPVDAGDFTMRDNEATDIHRWSRAGLAVTSARLGPFDPGARHRLYIQVIDNGGRFSLAILEITAFGASLDRDLLIVDDTRLRGDGFLSTGGGQCLRPYPSTAWPAAAELDTFLYAIGDVPWRGIAANCPAPVGAPVLSPSGIFDGYRFDTLGTRQGFENSDRAVPLSLLTRYRHVIWIVDGSAAQYTDPLSPLNPITSLRYMSEAGRASALEGYIGLGGKVWLVGAGAPLASMIGHNRTNNDQSLFGMVFSSAANPTPELGPGRVMFDRFHWKSEFIVGRTGNRILRSESVADPSSVGQPDYSSLPPELRRRSPATDPMPASRPASQTAAFYANFLDVAYVSRPNSIIEDVDPHPMGIDEQSTLDTLYALDASAGNLHPSGETTPRPIMTFYRGPSGPPTIVSGFAIWDLARPDAQALTDFVLGDLWQLSRQGKFARRAVALSERRPR